MTRTRRKPEGEADDALDNDEVTEVQEAPGLQADTELFERMKLPYCKDCKQLLQSSYMGHPICPINKSGCERNIQ